MGSLNGVKGGSFNQLLNVIKGFSRRSDSTLPGHKNDKILSNLIELVPSISFLMKEHPQHIPVMIYHISSVTSKIKIQFEKECVNGISSKYNYINNNNCKICKGTCKDVYYNFIDIIEENLPTLGPKGLSNIISTYSYCRDEKVYKILSEIQLRMCYFIYCGCKIGDRLYKNTNSNTNIDTILSKHSKQISRFPITNLQEGDYLINFVKYNSSNEDDCNILVNKSKYYIPVNLMDVCTIMDSIYPINYTRELKNNLSKYSSKVFLSDFNYLLMDLSFEYLFNNSFRSDMDANTITLDNNLDSSTYLNLDTNLDPCTNKDSKFEFNFKFINVFEINTVCRLINIFKQYGYNNDMLPYMIVEILNSSLDYLDFRNIVSLMDSLNFYNNRINLVDFTSVISRIDILTSRDELDSLKSLSTSIYIMSIMKGIVCLEEYNRFLKIGKNALERYVAKWRYLLKNQKSLRAITTILKSIHDQDTVNIVCKCVLEDMFNFDKSSLYDYNIMLDSLIKHYKKVINYFNTNTNSNNNNNNINNNNTNIDTHMYKSDSYITNFGENIEINTSDLSKISSTICLIISKCSPYYCGLISESLNNFKGDNSNIENKYNNSNTDNNNNTNNINNNKDNKLNIMDIRELCYFLNNISNFNNLEMTENPYEKDYNDQISILFKKVELFFIRNQTTLSEIDYTQISNFLHQLS